MLIVQDLLEAVEILGEENNVIQVVLQDEGVGVQMDTDVHVGPLGKMRASICNETKEYPNLIFYVAYADKVSQDGRKSKRNPLVYI